MGIEPTAPFVEAPIDLKSKGGTGLPSASVIPPTFLDYNICFIIIQVCCILVLFVIIKLFLYFYKRFYMV